MLPSIGLRLWNFACNVAVAPVVKRWYAVRPFHSTPRVPVTDLRPDCSCSFFVVLPRT